jgi:hypothetical protein
MIIHYSGSSSNLHLHDDVNKKKLPHPFHGFHVGGGNCGVLILKFRLKSTRMRLRISRLFLTGVFHFFNLISLNFTLRTQDGIGEK